MEQFFESPDSGVATMTSGPRNWIVESSDPILSQISIQFKECKKTKDVYSTELPLIIYKEPYKCDLLAVWPKGTTVHADISVRLDVIFENGDALPADKAPHLLMSAGKDATNPIRRKEESLEVKSFWLLVTSYQNGGKHFRLVVDFFNTHTQKTVAKFTSPSFLIRAKRSIFKPGSRKRSREEKENRDPPSKRRVVIHENDERALMPQSVMPHSRPLNMVTLKQENFPMGVSERSSFFPSELARIDIPRENIYELHAASVPFFFPPTSHGSISFAEEPFTPVNFNSDQVFDSPIVHKPELFSNETTSSLINSFTSFQEEKEKYCFVDEFPYMQVQQALADQGIPNNRLPTANELEENPQYFNSYFEPKSPTQMEMDFLSDGLASLRDLDAPIDDFYSFF